MSLISENVTAMALVQAYGRENSQQAQFESENQQSMESGITALRLSKTFKRVSDIVMAIGTFGVVYYGGRLALDGTVSPGTLVLFTAYLRNLYKPIEKFADLTLNLAKSQVAGERLMELIDSDMIMEDNPDAEPASTFNGKIEFRDVHFSYQTGIEVLKGINFIVQPGETVALVGASGAGKSTLISLLLRFYDPQNGQILIDDKHITKFTLKSVRAQITVVMQDALLFNKTVRENIAFGKDDATEEEIVYAARLAQADNFIKQMPNGYDTKIYEGGENLSGGQKKRLNIARAIIRNTPILIMDELSTALDVKAERAIHKALNELTADKTTFVIAHRFSSIANADKILVLDDGQLVGFGTHPELMDSCLSYRELYELQYDNLIKGSEVVSTESDNNEHSELNQISINS